MITAAERRQSSGLRATLALTLTRPHGVCSPLVALWVAACLQCCAHAPPGKHIKAVIGQKLGLQ